MKNEPFDVKMAAEPAVLMVDRDAAEQCGDDFDESSGGQLLASLFLGYPSCDGL